MLITFSFSKNRVWGGKDSLALFTGNAMKPWLAGEQETSSTQIEVSKYHFPPKETSGLWRKG